MMFDLFDCENVCHGDLSTQHHTRILVILLRFCECGGEWEENNSVSLLHYHHYWICLLPLCVGMILGVHEWFTLFLAEVVSWIAVVLLGIIKALVWLSQKVTKLGKTLLRWGIAMRTFRLALILRVHSAVYHRVARQQHQPRREIRDEDTNRETARVR
ncbi:expressed unknown protein [Seminavis robusta]|uniref:Uncharacterized protein n=1 Tax=Seminavis robusta TaxID=568900 RepID=A0A9N8EDN7_9STRA|nr:expressed unknown protein [Seminavis robusta]|eukprot:Sro999_g229650.1 n/a (158) ;mRNA; r:15931-16404